MALHLLTPLPDALAELGRVLALDGRVVATMPARGPMRARDLPVVAGLLAALGRGLGYPNDDPLRTGLPSLLDQAGLRMVADDRRCYYIPLRGKADADLFLASLYLPDLASVDAEPPTPTCWAWSAHVRASPYLCAASSPFPAEDDQIERRPHKLGELASGPRGGRFCNRPHTTTRQQAVPFGR